jgi:hypothetical protein
MLQRVVSQKLKDCSEVLTAFITVSLKMGAVSASETSVNFCDNTLCDIQEGGHLHTRSRENLKS